MHSLIVLASVLTCCVLIFENNVGAARRNLSKAEDLELERQLKLLNKPSIKTINTHYGDTYDCVDFYKQPAFDHPLLKNYTSNFEKISSKGRENIELSFGLKDGKCPVGTVPIKRITKQDLVREKLASLISIAGGGGPRPIDYPTNYATSNMDELGTMRFKGIEAIISVHNPSVSGPQYSAARIKLVVNNQDSIEAGWRVDPTLYGDTQTRLYIHTKAGQTNCFNTRCPGFIITNTTIPLDLVLDQISQRGGPIYEVPFKIIYDDTQGNWILQVGPDYSQVGYWPKSIFVSLDLPNHAEWGGETYKPIGMNNPPMGSGSEVVKDTNKDAFMRRMKIVNDRGDVVDPDTKSDITDIYYDVIVETHTNDYFQYLMFYGGPGQ